MPASYSKQHSKALRAALSAVRLMMSHVPYPPFPPGVTPAPLPAQENGGFLPSMPAYPNNLTGSAQVPPARSPPRKYAPDAAQGAVVPCHPSVSPRAMSNGHPPGSFYVAFAHFAEH